MRPAEALSHVAICLVQLEVLELHLPPEESCCKILSNALPTCTRLHTLVLVGANPLDLATLSQATRLEALALNFCAGMDAKQLTTLTSLRCSSTSDIMYFRVPVACPAGMVGPK